jgi:hypothetical protein
VDARRLLVSAIDGNDNDFYRSAGKTIVPLVRDGDHAPGGGTLTPLAPRATNDHGAIAYRAGVSGATARAPAASFVVTVVDNPGQSW